jgi:hypothetical protein
LRSGVEPLRAAYIAWAILVTSAAHVSAQTATSAPEWTLDASAYTYFLPDEGNYAQPTIATDRGWLHLEARVNYEDLDTGSIWFGYNFSGGETVEWALTPTIGGIFGQTDGVAPGYKGSVSWRHLEFYSEGEYVLDAHDSADSFFYNWSEVTFVPAEWLRVGLVTQRTSVYEAERDIQRGLLVGVSYKTLEATTYVFNPDDSQPVVVVSVAFSF